MKEKMVWIPEFTHKKPPLNAAVRTSHSARRSVRQLKAGFYFGEFRRANWYDRML